MNTAVSLSAAAPKLRPQSYSGSSASLVLASLHWQLRCRAPHETESVCWPAAGLAVVAYLYWPLGCGEYRMLSAKPGQRAHATSEERIMQRRRSAGRRAKTARRGLTLRSSGAPTAWRTGRQALGLRPIVRLPSSTPCRCRPLNSNVRQREAQYKSTTTIGHLCGLERAAG